jgi:hypothetical protein
MNLLNVIFISFGSFGKVIPKRSIEFASAENSVVQCIWGAHFTLYLHSVIFVISRI